MTAANPFRTVRVDPSQLDKVLDAMDRAREAFTKEHRETPERKRYRRHITVRVTQPGGSQYTFEVPTRNLSPGGVAFVHGGYLHVGSKCELQLITIDNAFQSVTGKVVRCRVLTGRMHEVGVKFAQPIDLTHFIANHLKGRVLLVDDAPDFLALAKHHLEKSGLSVVAVDDGSQALERIRNEEFNLVLVDVNMPGIGGLQITRTLRKEGLTTPIVAMSSDDTPECKTACSEAGANDFLPKPFDRQRLIDTLLRNLGNTGPLKSRFSSNPEMATLITEFLGGLPERIRKMHQAGDARDHEQLRALARNLKAVAGGSGGCGYDEIAAVAAQLDEALASPVIWDAVARCMTNLDGLARRAR